MPSDDNGNRREKDRSPHRSRVKHSGHRDRDRSRSRSDRKSGISNFKHSSPVRDRSSHDQSLSDSSKDISDRNFQGRDASRSDHRHRSRDRERSKVSAGVNPRASSVSNELYDSFVGGFVPIDRNGRRSGQEGDSIPSIRPNSSQPQRAGDSANSVDRPGLGCPVDSGSGATRTPPASAQFSAPPSGSQASSSGFSEDQIRQIHSIFDSYFQESSTGMFPT